MKLYRSIAVGVSPMSGTDSLSEGSRRAAEQARWLAERTGASLALVHSTWSEQVDQDEETTVASPAFAASVEALANECSKTGISTKIHYSLDRPWLALTKRALASESDLVIVGKHDESMPRGLGINTVNLLRNCPAPVWVVDPHTDRLGKCILAATDLSPVGERVTQMAAYLALESASELHIVHAWQRGMADQLHRDLESDEEAAVRISAKESEICERILAGLKDTEERLQPKLHIGCTSPQLAIEEGLEVLRPELVVMGTLSRTGISGLLIGNTAERLVGSIPCSLLTIKPADFVSPVAD